MKLIEFGIKIKQIRDINGSILIIWVLNGLLGLQVLNPFNPYYSLNELYQFRLLHNLYVTRLTKIYFYSGQYVKKCVIVSSFFLEEQPVYDPLLSGLNGLCHVISLITVMFELNDFDLLINGSSLNCTCFLDTHGSTQPDMMCCHLYLLNRRC